MFLFFLVLLKIRQWLLIKISENANFNNKILMKNIFRKITETIQKQLQENA
jgi:hypothetical protein